MATGFLIHRWFGGLILPVLVLLAAVWFTAARKPERWPGRAAQVFRVLVEIQFMLGFSAAVAKLALRRNRLSPRLGRWTPFALMFVFILAAGTLARLV